MASVDFVQCPKCFSKNWEDIPAAQEHDVVRFRCIRCKHTIRLGACIKCKAKAWTRLPDIVEKRGKRPVYRFRCGTCARILGIIIG